SPNFRSLSSRSGQATLGIGLPTDRSGKNSAYLPSSSLFNLSASALSPVTAARALHARDFSRRSGFLASSSRYSASPAGALAARRLSSTGLISGLGATSSLKYLITRRRVPRLALANSGTPLRRKAMIAASLA